MLGRVLLRQPVVAGGLRSGLLLCRGPDGAHPVSGGEPVRGGCHRSHCLPIGGILPSGELRFAMVRCWLRLHDPRHAGGLRPRERLPHGFDGGGLVRRGVRVQEHVGAGGLRQWVRVSGEVDRPDGVCCWFILPGWIGDSLCHREVVPCRGVCVCFLSGGLFLQRAIVEGRVCVWEYVPWG